MIRRVVPCSLVSNTTSLLSSVHLSNCNSDPDRCSVTSAFLTGAAQPAQPLLQRRLQASVPVRPNLAIFDNFLSGSSSGYIENMYLEWKKDPDSVDVTWKEVFQAAEGRDYDVPIMATAQHIASAHTTPGSVSQSLDDCTRLTLMIQAFREQGFHNAIVDPLHGKNTTLNRSPSVFDKSSLNPENFGLDEKDLLRTVNVGFMDKIGGISSTSSSITIKQLHQRLTEIYCGSIGFEFGHLSNDDRKRHFHEMLETDNKLMSKFSDVEQKAILKEVASPVLFEDLLHRKYTTKKRFGLDGGESMIVGMNAMLEEASESGIEDVVCGMAHRGRLSCLVHIFGKPLEVLLHEFKGVQNGELAPHKIQSDVKYHLGSKVTKAFGKSSKEITVELLDNPSHLEAVNPLVQGKAKASQVRRGDNEGKKVLPVEIHGDAAFSGQGVVFETMSISELGEYHTGGTIHIVCNNQIGFTTDPKFSRSSANCTDLGHVFDAPIFHVNGDSVEDVIRVFKLAVNYRVQFNKSVLINLVCYRRNGHNESDVPSLTQPLFYKAIDSHPNILDSYGRNLIKQNVITEADLKELKSEMKAEFNNIFDKVSKGGVNYAEYLTSRIPPCWKDMAYSFGTPEMSPTALTSKDSFSNIINALGTLPENFTPHPTLRKILDRRDESLTAGTDIEWGVGEALAFGSLLEEGIHVRISGQDVERATFSQRHTVLHDQNNGESYCQLKNISDSQALFSITNSPLSEYGVLGYETGYTLEHPNSLVIWEAQFGDFANGAQIIFDQFLSSGETKWNTMYAPIVSMPHGYDGMGPEHSSGRIERVLQHVNECEYTPSMSEEERHHLVNMEITYPTTSAQYFHLLRRHVKRNFRKPLINFFSKKYLRAVTGCTNMSSIEEFIGDSKFMPLIPDSVVTPDRCHRVVFCTGQIYHHLYLARAKTGEAASNVALVRIEQLSPFPVTEVKEILKEYPTQELVWAQEEPQNMGAWWHVQPRFDVYTDGGRELKYAGRYPAASSATGYSHAHTFQQDAVVKAALN